MSFFCVFNYSTIKLLRDLYYRDNTMDTVTYDDNDYHFRIVNFVTQRYPEAVELIVF